MVKMIKGDITETDCELIAHGVNCQNKMGSGVAKALFIRWPEVKKSYHRSFDERFCFFHPHEILSNVQFDIIEKGRAIAHCFTQQNYGYDGQIYIDYDALEDCLDIVKCEARDAGIYEIAMPKIGCGLAGGDWSIVKKIIENVFLDSEITVKVYYLED